VCKSAPDFFDNERILFEILAVASQVK